MALKHEFDAIENKVNECKSQSETNTAFSEARWNLLTNNIKSILGNTKGSVGSVSPLIASLEAADVLCRLMEHDPKVANGVSFQVAAIAADTRSPEAVFFAVKELSKHVTNPNMAVKCAAKLSGYASNHKTRANMSEYLLSTEYAIAISKR